MIIINEEQIKELVIAICDGDFERIEEIQENEPFNNLEIDFQNSDVMDFISCIHRYTAEKYIKRAIKVLESIVNKDVRGIVREIVPIKDLLKFEYNSNEFKNMEHYF